MRVAIVGCGLIGAKRAKALLGAARGDKVVAVVDPNLFRAQQTAAQFSDCFASGDWREAVRRPDVELVVVSTTNDQLAAATLGAVEAGKHVLVEKPAARNVAELEPVAKAAREAFERSGTIVKVGFNHRFHPALLKAREIVDAGGLGPLMFIRARYGHGGRLGMEKEWRGDPKISGGGEMLDQGVHLIDLSRWFLGDFNEVGGYVSTFFWKWPVEDNGFALLKTPTGKVAWLHASCTEWKNLFSMEIYGREGKIAIDGLGGSYGVERIAHYKMSPEMGPPQTTIWEYPGEDSSWEVEWIHMLDCIGHRRQPLGTLDDAVAALKIVERLYARGKKK